MPYGYGYGFGYKGRIGSSSPLLITGPSSFTFENGDQPYTLSGISFVYTGDGADGYTVTIAVGGGGTFTAAASSPPVITGDGTSNVTFNAGTTLAQAISAINGDIAGLDTESVGMTITITNNATSEQAVKVITLTAEAPVSYMPSLTFSDGRNSQYIPTII